MILRIAAILQGVSNLPEDRYVNNFHVEKTGGAFTAGELSDLSQAVQDFYNLAVVGGTAVISDYLASFVSRAANASEVKMYDAQAVGSPLFEDVFTLNAIGAVTNLPAEIAACLSFHADFGSALEEGAAGTRPRARRRGRVFVGPLNVGAVTQVGATEPILNAAFQGDLIGAADRFGDDVEAANGEWVVYSGTDNVARNIVEVWVDNAFDVQRRRGRAATARQTALIA